MSGCFDTLLAIARDIGRSIPAFECVALVGMIVLAVA